MTNAHFLLPKPNPSRRIHKLRIAQGLLQAKRESHSSEASFRNSFFDESFQAFFLDDSFLLQN